MVFDLVKLEQLALSGKVSVIFALNPDMRKHWCDWESSNQDRNWRRNTNAKNAKAKHRKKFNR